MLRIFCHRNPREKKICKGNISCNMCVINVHAKQQVAFTSTYVTVIYFELHVNPLASSALSAANGCFRFATINHRTEQITLAVVERSVAETDAHPLVAFFKDIRIQDSPFTTERLIAGKGVINR